jgi:hypothetical protein
MPVTFRQIAANSAKVTIQTDLGPVTIEYYPNKITDALLAEIQATRDANVPMTEILKSWDIYEDDDFTVMFPIERVAEFGIPFKIQILEAIMETMRPNGIAPQTTRN